ncbi:uncharacterized protein K460DRAFT_104814 [Cucurbitaria berberidis CBS 394.84]|uniref:Uncharacterized protein n=1 Tax=Cucurbitaria berberidis CBS 394.84 TaxID=1168544 RepID=A0A9P4GFN4_9PLEO|nr:uncharacterized protein K460DRAFT_104814 [Cucurbitaria berberidis CBS 394.84]KAF1845193.1 hypothetical protein K460DRAFT_104814 [Cucurbitaria berberidis CBS 394.84]
MEATLSLLEKVQSRGSRSPKWLSPARTWRSIQTTKRPCGRTVYAPVTTRSEGFWHRCTSLALTCRYPLRSGWLYWAPVNLHAGRKRLQHPGRPEMGHFVLDSLLFPERRQAVEVQQGLKESTAI